MKSFAACIRLAIITVPVLILAACGSSGGGGGGGGGETDYDADLASVTLSAGTLSPAFAASTTAYTVALDCMTKSMTITPTTADTNATVTVNGTPVTSGTASGSIALAPYANTITVSVTAQSGTVKNYVITVNRDGEWYQDAYLKASNTGVELFGSSVSISGDTIVVGTYREESNQTTITNTNGSASADNSAIDSGAAYVFKCDASGNWYQDAYLKASNAEANDFFGISVSISGDAIVVGAAGESSNQTTITNTNGSASADNSAGLSSSAYVFKCDASGNWYQDAFLKASNAESLDRFGWSASISGDTIVIGAYAEDSNQTTIFNTDGSASTNNSAGNAGAVYVFKVR